jgi:ribosomal protein S18 acetylase RimI-like enzyme
MTFVWFESLDEVGAQALLDVQRAAYTQEAQLIGVPTAYFPPLRLQVSDLLVSRVRFGGIWAGERLVAAVGVETLGGEADFQIESVVVHPDFQRRGLAALMLREALSLHPKANWLVETAAANAPALALYQRFGFRELKRRSVSEPPLALVSLRLA